METETVVEMETMMSALTKEPLNRPAEEEEEEEEEKLQESISMFKLMFVCVILIF